MANNHNIGQNGIKNSGPTTNSDQHLDSGFDTIEAFFDYLDNGDNIIDTKIDNATLNNLYVAALGETASADFFNTFGGANGIDSPMELKNALQAIDDLTKEDVFALATNDAKGKGKGKGKAKGEGKPKQDVPKQDVPKQDVPKQEVKDVPTEVQNKDKGKGKGKGKGKKDRSDKSSNMQSTTTDNSQ